MALLQRLNMDRQNNVEVNIKVKNNDLPFFSPLIKSCSIKDHQHVLPTYF